MYKRNKLSRFSVLIASFFAPPLAYAVTLGELSENLLTPTTAIAHAGYLLCYIAGAAFCAGALIQYRRHRQNPSAVRLSQPVFQFIFGLVLFALPLITSYSLAYQTVN